MRLAAGATGGIASWWGVGGTFIHSSLITVNQADQIYGYMHYVGDTQNGCCWEYVQASDTTTGVSSYLSFQDATYTFYYWSFGGALEVYNMLDCNDYPLGVSGSNLGYTSFTSITLYGNNKLSPSWSTYVNSQITPQCGFGVTSSTSIINLFYNP